MMSRRPSRSKSQSWCQQLWKQVFSSPPADMTMPVQSGNIEIWGSGVKCCLIYSVNSSPRACRACAQRHKGMVEVLSLGREQASQQAHPAIKITRAHLTYSTICSQQPVVRLDVDINEDATPRMSRTWFSTTFRSPGRRHQRSCDTSDAQNVVFSHFLVAWTSTSTRMRHLGCRERSFQPWSGRLDVDVNEDATPRMPRT